MRLRCATFRCLKQVKIAVYVWKKTLMPRLISCNGSNYLHHTPSSRYHHNILLARMHISSRL